MTAGENVLLNTMKLDKTVNQQSRPFTPKEEKKKKVNSTNERNARVEENTSWQKQT